MEEGGLSLTYLSLVSIVAQSNLVYKVPVWSHNGHMQKKLHRAYGTYVLQVTDITQISQTPLAHSLHGNKSQSQSWNAI